MLNQILISAALAKGSLSDLAGLANHEINEAQDCAFKDLNILRAKAKFPAVRSPAVCLSNAYAMIIEYLFSSQNR